MFSLCVHEFSHAAVAYLGGDHTVKDKGYLSMNPLKYTDPLLSIGFPLVILLLGGLGLPGGAVYIDHRLLRSRGWDCAVSLAGPASNALLALLLSVPFALGLVDPNSTDPFWQAYAFLIVLQICAVFLNMLPVPPLDGWGALSSWLSYETQVRAGRYGTYGIFIIFILFWSVPSFSARFWRARVSQQRKRTAEFRRSWRFAGVGLRWSGSSDPAWMGIG